MKLTGSHFERIEVIEAESQAVPNALTEHRLPGRIQKIV
jgi:hypothetical protein